MKSLLKKGRESQGLSIAAASRSSKIDTALLSKFESGNRMPTNSQIFLLAELYKIDAKELEIAWLKQKILQLVDKSDVAIEALQAVLTDMGAQNSSQSLATPSIEKLMAEMEALKSILTSPKK